MRMTDEHWVKRYQIKQWYQTAPLCCTVYLPPPPSQIGEFLVLVRCRYFISLWKSITAAVATIVTANATDSISSGRMWKMFVCLFSLFEQKNTFIEWTLALVPFDVIAVACCCVPLPQFILFMFVLVNYVAFVVNLNSVYIYYSHDVRLLCCHGLFCLCFTHSSCLSSNSNDDDDMQIINKIVNSFINK